MKDFRRITTALIHQFPDDPFEFTAVSLGLVIRRGPVYVNVNSPIKNIEPHEMVRVPSSILGHDVDLCKIRFALGSHKNCGTLHFGDSCRVGGQKEPLVLPYQFTPPRYSPAFIISTDEMLEMCGPSYEDLLYHVDGRYYTVGRSMIRCGGALYDTTDETPTFSIPGWVAKLHSPRAGTYVYLEDSFTLCIDCADFSIRLPRSYTPPVIFETLRDLGSAKTKCIGILDPFSLMHVLKTNPRKPSFFLCSEGETLHVSDCNAKGSVMVSAAVLRYVSTCPFFARARVSVQVCKSWLIITGSDGFYVAMKRGVSR